MAHAIETLSESERTKKMDEPQKQKQQQQKKKNKITCRRIFVLVNVCFSDVPVTNLLQILSQQLAQSNRASSVQDLYIWISDAMDGDVIILTLRLPRTVPRRVSFSTNIKFLVGFCIFASEIFYVSVHNEPMNQEKRALLNLMLFTGSMMFIILIEISQLVPHRLTLEERRFVRLVGWLQEALISIVFVTMVYWIFRTPVVQSGTTSDY